MDQVLKNKHTISQFIGNLPTKKYLLMRKNSLLSWRPKELYTKHACYYEFMTSHDENGSHAQLTPTIFLRLVLAAWNVAGLWGSYGVHVEMILNITWWNGRLLSNLFLMVA